MTGERSDHPRLRVVRGDPTPEELAALTVVLAVTMSQPADPVPPPRSLWRDRGRLMRQPTHPGPGAWRASARPR
ncbi:MAG TPA: acyl-CoA carboxylase subunit epsilon [Micromonosporaceae bacterium]|nr:acyl-CoA carboxylase subunit epsilon [Micromonosporaceae bacterium]